MAYLSYYFLNSFVLARVNKGRIRKLFKIGIRVIVVRLFKGFVINLELYFNKGDNEVGNSKNFKKSVEVWRNEKPEVRFCYVVGIVIIVIILLPYKGIVLTIRDFKKRDIVLLKVSIIFYKINL
ncbi:hypothetical protein V8F20_012348 [Naviculisporaceae sp. PSN 640]